MPPGLVWMSPRISIKAQWGWLVNPPDWNWQRLHRVFQWVCSVQLPWPFGPYLDHGRLTRSTTTCKLESGGMSINGLRRRQGLFGGSWVISINVQKIIEAILENLNVWCGLKNVWDVPRHKFRASYWGPGRFVFCIVFVLLPHTIPNNGDCFLYSAHTELSAWVKATINRDHIWGYEKQYGEKHSSPMFKLLIPLSLVW